MPGTGNDFPVWWPLKDGVRADWNIPELLKFISNNGLRALWEPICLCPCGDPAGNSPDPTCPVCGGRGEFAYASQEVRVVTVGHSREFDPFLQWGRAEPGQAYFTVRPEHAPAQNDRLTLLDSRISFVERRVREAAVAETEQDPPALERLQYPIVAQEVVEEMQADTIAVKTYNLDVLHLRASDGGLGGDPLVKGTDFEVTEAGLLDWTKGDVAGTAPAPGTLFTVAYKTRPVYRVFGVPHAVRDTWNRRKVELARPDPLPVQWMGKLEQVIP